MRALWLTFLISALSLLAWQRCSPVEHSPGVLVTKAPEQTVLKPLPPSIAKDGWSLKPLATFSLEARVLGAKRYAEDFTSTIAPYDLALGWGPMSDEAVLEKIDISQKNRFYRWRYWGRAPIPERDITMHSANMHIIPADAAVLAQLASLRKGAIVRLAGSLVVATHPNATKPWCTSLKRDDEGEGACEVFYVREVERLRG